jgi:hypothetical protein
VPQIEVDFDTYKELVTRRPSEDVSEGDVVRSLLGLTRKQAPTAGRSWVSEGVHLWVGTELRHRFRGGDIVSAEIVDDGIRVAGQTFSGLSPAAAFAAGHQANGWQFWEYQVEPGKWVKVDALRHGAR